MVRLIAVCVLGAALAGSASAEAATAYEPLNCERATSPAEVAICRSYGLGQQEAHMATLYAVVMSLSGMGVRGDIGESQRTWLEERNACGQDLACLAQAYRSRNQVLQRAFENIAARGPF